MNTLIFFGMLAVCLGTGSYIEKRHYANIEKREKACKTPVLLTRRTIKNTAQVSETRFVSASVVVGADFFKHTLAGIIQIFGGPISSYESVLDRARREVFLRLQEQATEFDEIVNVKIETCMLGRVKRRQGSPKAAVFAYGTAIRYK